MNLGRLRADAVRLVTPELASGVLVRPTEPALEGLVEPATREIELDGLREALERLMTATSPFDAAMDARAAVDVHQALQLTRREASDPGIWRFMTVVVSPEFVRHRYENNSWSTMRSRFWSMGTRPDSNTLFRLWWIAELSRDGADYELTRRILTRQTLTNAIFVRNLSWYAPAVRAVAETLEHESREVIESVMLEFTRLLGTAPLEGMSHPQLVDVLGALRELCRSRTE